MVSTYILERNFIMKKATLVLALVTSVITVLSGCSGDASTSKTYTYSLDTGDEISIELDTSDGYDITSDVPFAITLDDETLTQGTFIQASYYDEYVATAKEDENVTIIEESTKDGNSYMFWNYADEEWDIVLLIAESETAILLGNNISQESAQACFDRMTIALK